MDVDSMKKTTTRLATAAVVVVTGAFAIALAQHDSRQRAQESDVENLFTSAQPQPLIVNDGDWSARLPELPAAGAETTPAQLVSASRGMPASARAGGVEQRWRPDAADGQVADPADEASFESQWDDEEQANPLRRAGLGLFEASAANALSGELEFPQSQVIAASAEEPVIPPQLPPAWLGNTAATEEAGGLSPQALPTLPTFPLGTPGTTPAQLPTVPTAPEQAGLPAATGGRPGGNVSLGMPQLPPNTDPGLPTAASASRGAGQSLSDTQRGAMLPTNLTPTNLGGSSSAIAAGGSTRGAAFPTDGAVPRGAGAGPQSMGQLGASPQSGSGPPAVGRSGALVHDMPASRYLDGSQNPILLIQKRAPEEIQVGKPATFVITVRNAGSSTAHDVTVIDAVPRGTRLADANPPVNPASDGTLTWQLGEMAAGGERTLSVQIVPEVEGEIGSVAAVTFATQASVRTVATRPRVEVLLEASQEVLIGNSHQVQVTIANTGSGIARNVRLEADIPKQLRHESGEALLDAAIGNLRPNESKRIQLSTGAVEAGMAECIVRAVDEDGVQAEQRAMVHVKSPQLVAAIEGPGRRFLERQATYRIAVQNSGTATATNLDFVIHLPAGLKFISTDIPHSTFDPKTNSVKLGLFELIPGKIAPIALTVLPVEIGPQLIKLKATADLGINTEAVGQVQVDGLAELAFTIGQDNGTVEVGASSTYSVQISNVGNQTDRQVQLVAQLPAGAELLAVDAPVDYRFEGQSIIFSPLAELKSKGQHIYRFQVRHNTAGNQVVRTQLTSANWPVPVVKEEGTLVYNDK
jgi:uncharacterized repeat protein (TIGR01451 family)